MALKVVKSAQHYTETALDEIKLLKCVSKSFIVLFLIHMSIIQIYVVSHVHPTGQPAVVLCNKNFNIEHYTQTVQSDFAYLSC